MGARVQHFENIASSTVGGAGLVLIAGLWTGAGSGVGGILGRNAAQLAVVTGTYLGKRFVTNKTMVVNQMAAHIKTLPICLTLPTMPLMISSLKAQPNAHNTAPILKQSTLLHLNKSHG